MKRRRKHRLFYLLSILLAIIAVSYWTLLGLNRRLLPTVMEITQHNSQIQINRAVNNALANFTEINSLTSADFYIQTYNDENKLTSLSVNTILVNKICAQLAVEISDALTDSEIQEVYIPVGIALGIEAFANLGPKYKVSLLPLGRALVDYESNFSAVGINQINFQIWLNIESSVKVVNPLQDRDFMVTRKIALVDTVFSGEIPKIIGRPLWPE